MLHSASMINFDIKLYMLFYTNMKYPYKFMVNSIFLFESEQDFSDMENVMEKPYMPIVISTMMHLYILI